MLTIKGLYSISTDILRPLLKFVAKKLPLNEEICITEEEEYIIINSEAYLIMTEYDEFELMKEYEEELYKKWISDVREDVKHYIDREAWNEDNGVTDFEEYWSTVHKDSLTYVDTIDNYNFYKVGE